jgi:HEAT repeat protein
MRTKLLPFLILGLIATPAIAYVDMAPTLGSIIRDAHTIALVEVDRFRPETGALLLKKVRDLKGSADESVKHQLLREGESAVEPALFEWAEPGRRGILLVSNRTALVCVGRGWYQANASADGWWRIGAPRPDLPLAYWGNVSRLTDAIERMLKGRSAIITMLPHGAEQEGASFDLALNRANLPGLVKVQRLKANLQMPPKVLMVSASTAYLVGPGLAGEDEIPALRDKLKDADAEVRAESAGDLGSLGARSASAKADLALLLDDPAPTVALAAAGALLRIEPNEPRALGALKKGLASADPIIRRHAASAIGMSGSAALAEALVAALRDTDLRVRRTALQAVATLGPAAAKTTDAVAELLDEPAAATDAADALGRIGPAARPTLKKIAKLLTTGPKTQHWAAVRAMSQIGGADAHPAVDFMIRELPRASEYDGYNILIYLAMLGPVAKDAIPAIYQSRVKNPILRQSTAWAIEPDGRFPFGFGMGDADFARFIFESYLRELGDNLKPGAVAMAKKTLDGQTNDLPTWAFDLLARYPEDSLAVLTPALKSDSLARRERAAVAIGYMGPAGVGAKGDVASAIDRAGGEKERRLMRWTLRHIETK